MQYDFEESNLRTKVTRSKDRKKVYEIERSYEGKQGLTFYLIMLYPVSVSAYQMDDTQKSILSHVEDIQASRIVIWNLFSDVIGTKAKVSQLKYDESNLEFLETQLKGLQKEKGINLVICWGSTFAGNALVDKTKFDVQELIKKYIPKVKLQQLTCKALSSNHSNYHPLYLSIRGNSKWVLEEFKMMEKDKFIKSTSDDLTEERIETVCLE